MDRRQRKTREAIFCAFLSLLQKKDFQKITVEEIIQKADVGRATFYAHFETKDYLLKEFSEDLFCHLFDMEENNPHNHRHLFDCEQTEDVFYHLFWHIAQDDHHLKRLLTGKNNQLFLSYFQDNLKKLVVKKLPVFLEKKPEELPVDFFISHITATFLQTLTWWAETKFLSSPKTITQYFYLTV